MWASYGLVLDGPKFLECPRGDLVAHLFQNFSRSCIDRVLAWFDEAPGQEEDFLVVWTDSQDLVAAKGYPDCDFDRFIHDHIMAPGVVSSRVRALASDMTPSGAAA